MRNTAEEGGDYCEMCHDVPDEEMLDWRRSCAYCHVTGYDQETMEYTEMGVGCEACHGPGSQHVLAPDIEKGEFIINTGKLPRHLQADVCGQCHNRGTSPDGKFNHPVNYHPGTRLLNSNFQSVPFYNEEAWTMSGHARLTRQQYPEWFESRHRIAGIACTVCHSVHGASTRFATRLSQVNLCVECHVEIDTDSVTGHAPIKGAPQHGDCIGCHMMMTGFSSESSYERSHRFKVVKPEWTLKRLDDDRHIYTDEEGNVDWAQLIKDEPNSCNACHAHQDMSDPVNWPDHLQDMLDQGPKVRLQMNGVRH
jgi:predicted CXXCH cytochrome family protein